MPQVADRVFIVIALIALVGLYVQPLHSYNGFGSYPDMSYFDQTVWSLLHGGLVDSIVLFGRRFNPIMFVLVPLYAVWSDPRMLILLQSVGLVATIFPLYWFARSRVGHLLALTIVLTFLTSLSVQAVNLPVFAEIKLAVPILSFALFFLLRNRYRPFFACLGVALLLKQEVAFIAVGFAVFIFLYQQKRALGLVIAAIGVALALFIIQILYPSLYSSQYSVFSERYSYLGNSLQGIVVSIISRPYLVIQHVLVPPKIEFVLFLLTPLAFLPLLGVEVFAISFPSWLYTLLSDYPQQYETGQYYQAPFLPFLFFGAVIGLDRLLRWRRKTAAESGARIKLALCALLVASSQLYLPGSWVRLFNPNSFVVNQHAVIGQQIMALLPKGATVVAQTEFVVPLVAKRDYDVVEFSPHGDYRNADYLFGDSTLFWYGFHRVAWEHWRASGYFESIVEQDGYFLLRRKALSDPLRQIDNGWALLGYTDKPNLFNQPVGFEFGNSLTLLGYAPVPSVGLRGGEQLRVIIEWRAKQDIQNRYTMLAHLIDSRGNVWVQDDREPIIPTDQWKSGDIVRNQYDFTLLRTMPPGSYRLSISVWDSATEKSLAISSPQGQSLGIEAGIGTLQVEKDTSSIEASYLGIENPKYVDMREIRLLGSKSLPDKMIPGGELQIGLYWRARQKPLGDYTVSVQLRDASRQTAFEQIDRPANGEYPTTLWHVGEVLLDYHDLKLPTSLAPGTYGIVVTLRDEKVGTVLGQTEIGHIGVGVE